MGSGKFINQKYKCIIYSKWTIMAWQHSPEASVKSFKKTIYPMQWMRLMLVYYGMAVKRMGM